MLQLEASSDNWRKQEETWDKKQCRQIKNKMRMSEREDMLKIIVDSQYLENIY